MSDDLDVPPDSIVRTALQLLPVPTHGDAFWARLEASLDAEEPLAMPVEPVRRVLLADPDADPRHAAPPGPTPVVELEHDHALHLVPPTFRRASNALLAGLAAAALVVATIAGASLLEEQQDADVSSDDPADDPALETLVRNAQSGGTVTTISARHEDASSDAVLEWVDHLGAGDATAAWSAMGDTSQAHFASQAEFEGLMTDLAEGYGAWSAAEPDDVLVTPVSADDEGTIAVVTLVGTLDQEGTTEHRAEAFPVRIVKGHVVLEPFASAGDLEVAIPERTSDDTSWESVGTDEELVFVVPGSAEAPVLRIDGGDTVICGEADGTDLHDLDQAPGQRCSYLPEGGFEPGPHTATVAFLGADGTSITAESILFDAA